MKKSKRNKKLIKEIISNFKYAEVKTFNAKYEDFNLIAGAFYMIMRSILEDYIKNKKNDKQIKNR